MNAFFIIIEIFTYIFVFHYLLGCTFTSIKSRIFISCIISFVWLYIQVLMETPLPAIYNTLIISFICILLFQDSTRFKVTWVIICTTLNKLLDYTIYHSLHLMNHYLFHNNTILNLPYHNIEYFSLLLIIIVSLFFAKAYQQQLHILFELHSGTDYFINIICLLTLFMLHISELLIPDSFNEQFLPLPEIFSLLFALFSGAALLFILKIQYQNLQLHQLFSINQKELELEKKQYQLLQEKNQALRAFRHDFNGHLLALQTYACLGEQDKLYEYINHLSIIQKSLHSFATENIIVDAVLNQTAQALDDTTNFKVSGLFPPECFIKDMDLCILFTNLLSNAVEALKKLDSHTPKELYVEIHSMAQEIQITVTNTSLPYNVQELQHLTTTKTDKSNHGFGLSNIRKIAQKYRGDLIVRYHNGMFSTCVSCKYVY